MKNWDDLSKRKVYTLPVKYHDLTIQQKQEVREQYIVEQKGLCYFCNKPITEEPPDKIQKLEINLNLFPRNFLDNKIHLQHNHNTGFTEGAVHARCNAVLWQYHGR